MTTRTCCLAALVSLLGVSLCASSLYAQTLTYSVEGEVTSVPPCVADVFAKGDRWTLEQVVELPPLVEEDETAPPDTAAVTDSESTQDDAESAQDKDGSNADDPASSVEVVTQTKHHRASAFSWTIGDVSGSVRGVTRVFVSNDHLGQDSITWQALDYSAAFTPSGLNAVGIRGIQAGLADMTSSVFESTDLPDELERTRFGGDGFLQVLFQKPCGYFRRDTPIAGSVSSVQVRWEPAQ